MYFVSSNIDMYMRQRGWFPSRKYPVDEWVFGLYQHKYDITRKAIQILEEFGAIQVSGLIAASHTNGNTEFIFDPLVGIQYTFNDCIFLWEERLNTSLTPIASIAECGTLLASRHGSIFAILFSTMYQLGSDIYTTIEDYCLSNTGTWRVLDAL
jgi:hypothetical protein